jgi:predicted RNA-binding Zn-ribbon protein involved in translation (DUF1610 family)
MSFGKGSADELLMRGLAAAQSGDPRDHEEAVFYLEWVLRNQPEPHQEIEAWYWLSRLTDDPIRKRECLENVLAMRPTHPDARRDLAILDGRLKTSNLRTGPLQPAVPVATGGQIDAGQVATFPCPKCGAKLHFDPSAGVARCQHCGAQADAEGKLIEDAQGGPEISTGMVSEQDWVAAIYTDEGHRWALPGESILQCGSCGASVTLAPSVISGKCPYCGAPQLVRVAAATMGELREPDGVVPFAVGQSGVQQAMHTWLEGQSKRMGVPSDLRDLATLVSGTPLYAPFWTFDVSGQIEWSGYIRADIDIAGVGLDDFDTVMRLGGVAGLLLTGQYDIAAQGAAGMAAKKFDKSNLTYGSGTAVVLLDDTLVPASKSLPQEQVETLAYDTKKAAPYREELLASWPAEVYTVSMADASLTARERAMKEADKEVEIQTGGTADIATLRVDRTGLAVMSYKLLLLPVWVVMYTYRGQAYRALVNGQSGAVEGDVPWSDNLVGKIMGK